MTLADRIDAVLPQTQCRRCGYPDCRAYAEAIAAGEVDIDRCPPGGREGIARLARVTGRPERPLDEARGLEGPLLKARIDEAWCIGCTLCIAACPVDCIVGAPKALHAVVTEDCTGCDLCAPACPVDCISMHPDDPTRTGWAAWSTEQAEAARTAYRQREARRLQAQAEREARHEAEARHKLDHLLQTTRGAEDPDEAARKRAVIQAALERARLARQAR